MPREVADIKKVRIEKRSFYFQGEGFINTDLRPFSSSRSAVGRTPPVRYRARKIQIPICDEAVDTRTMQLRIEEVAC